MKLDMGRAWNDAVALFSANRELMLVTAGVFFFIPAVLVAILIPQPDPASMPTGGDGVAVMEAMQAQMLAIYGDYWWLLALTTLAQAIGLLALLALLNDAGKPTLGDALKIGVIGLAPYIGAYILIVLALSLVIGVLVGVPAALAPASAVVTIPIAIVGFIYVMVKLSLTLPVIAIDKVMNPLAVISRSWKLTRGNSLRLFGFYLLLALVYIILSVIVGAVFGVVGALAGGATLVSGLVNGLISAAGTMIMAALLAAIHRQLAGPTHARISETFE